MTDSDALLERAYDFLGEMELTEVPTNPVGAIAGIPPGIAAHVYGKKKIKKLTAKKGKRARRKAVQDFDDAHPTLAKAYIPKNEKAMKRLAKRGPGGHVAHGSMRYFGAPLGFTNTVRYAHKVKAAKKGLHREM